MTKLTRTFLVCGAVTGLLLFGQFQSSAQQTRWYVKVDAGGNLTEETDFEEFFGPVAPGSQVVFDPGFRFGMAVGYWLTDWFALEFEAGANENFIKSITDASDVDALFSNVPLFVNAKFRWPNQTRFTPYIGGGAGVAFSILDIDHMYLNGTYASGADGDTVFAYQGFAGLRYSLADNMGVAVEYHYMGTQSPDFGPIRFGDIQTHVFSLVFDLSF